MYNKTKQFEMLKSLGKEGLLLNHYELEEKLPEYSYEDWRELLKDPEVSLYITNEFDIIREAELRKIQAKASDDSKSVGLAQIMNSMQSLSEKSKGKKEGPVFIYTYIPPSSEQMKASNVRVVDYLKAKEEQEKPEEVLIQEIQKGDPRWLS